MMGLLDGIVANMFGKATPIADRSALGRFMDSRAAFLAQKCVVEFCRVPQGESETFWQSALDEVRERLAATQSGPPRPVREMPDPLARRIFDALPLHRTVVTNDYDYIFNNLRMNLLRAHEDFLAAAWLESLVDDLLGTD